MDKEVLSTIPHRIQTVIYSDCAQTTPRSSRPDVIIMRFRNLTIVGRGHERAVFIGVVSGY